MPNFDWNWNSYGTKNLDEQRQDAEKAKLQSKYGSTRRIGAMIFAIAVVLLGNISSAISDITVESLSVIIIFAVIVLSIIAFAAGVILYRRVKRKQNEADTYDTTRAYSQHARPQQSEDRYTAYTYTDNDYSRVVDAWDIKDPKPPWEL